MALRDTRANNRGGRPNQSIEYRALYALGFVIFFATAIIRRLLPIDRLFRGRQRPQMSIVREAREATSATIPYAFMG